MNSKWVSFSPHILSKNSTTNTYLLMIVLLCPIIASAVVTLNFLPLATVVVCMTSAYLTDIAFKYVVERKYNFTDLSALFIGLVIGLTMPTGINPFMPIVGTVFSMIFIRNIAGGIGKNFVSEVAMATLITSLIFASDFYNFQTANGVQTISFLERVLSKEVGSAEVGKLLFGGIAGSIAETSVFWLLVAGIVLIFANIIDFRVPLATFVSTLLFAILFFDVTSAINLVLSGGVIIVSIFVATDYAVVPRNKWIKYIYGLVIGFVTVIIWKYGNFPLMGAYYAVVCAGLLSSVFNGLLKQLRHKGV